MEFRNHQTWVRYRADALRQSPVAAVLFALVFLLLLIPLLAIATLGIAVLVIAVPVRLALAEWRRRRRGAPRVAGRPTGPVIDVEVTRSESR